MYRVVVLGASVSAQSVDHKSGRLTGYSEALKSKSCDDFPIAEIERRTYAGNRLSDGGLLRLAEVVKLRPDICLFEPLIEDRTRGVRATDDEILFVYASLVDAGIVPITVMLPVPEQRHPRGNPEYARYDALCRKHGLPTVLVDLSDLPSIAEYITTSPHTSEAGAHLYADQIIRGLVALGDPARLMEAIHDLPQPTDIPLHVLRLSKVRRGGREGEMTFALQARSDAPVTARLVQLQRIGPWSPVIEMRCTGDGEPPRTETLSVWDPYCHFERHSYVNLAVFTLTPGTTVEIELRIADADPDYSRCRRAVENWPTATERKLMPLGHAFVIADGEVIEP